MLPRHVTAAGVEKSMLSLLAGSASNIKLTSSGSIPHSTFTRSQQTQQTKENDKDESLTALTTGTGECGTCQSKAVCTQPHGPEKTPYQAT